MQKVQSLAEFLNVTDPRTDEQKALDNAPSIVDLLDIADPTEFCKQIVRSREFRQYIMNGIVLGTIQPAVLTRVIDHAWGKPPERVEHTGKDGQPIVTEVRRVIVRPEPRTFGDDDAPREQKHVTH